MSDVFAGLGALGAGGVGWLASLRPGVAVAVVAVLVLGGIAVRYLEAHERTRLARVGWEGAVAVYRAKGDGAAVARAVHQTEQTAPAGAPAGEGRWFGLRRGLWRRS